MHLPTRNNKMSAEAMSPLRTSSPAPLEPPDVGTLSVAQDDRPQLVSPDEAARAWIAHLRNEGNMPERNNLIGLLEALVISRVPRLMPTADRTDIDVRMVIEDTSLNKKFPHMVDTQNGRLTGDDAIWTQCKTKMTHFCVRLVDSHGMPVKGSDVQDGGVELRLTMHKVVGDSSEALDNDSNPRPFEDLFRGRANGVFDPVVVLTESRHEFRFQVLLLSSDIGGARMFVKVAPTDPKLALDPKLTVQSRSFLSRARMPDESYSHNRDDRQTAKRQAAASQLLTMALTLADSQDLSPPASVDMDTFEEAPNKRQCSPEPSLVAQTDTP